MPSLEGWLTCDRAPRTSRKRGAGQPARRFWGQGVQLVGEHLDPEWCGTTGRLKVSQQGLEGDSSVAR